MFMQCQFFSNGSQFPIATIMRIIAIQLYTVPELQNGDAKIHPHNVMQLISYLISSLAIAII